MKKYYIYTLTDPIEKEIKYIGKTKDLKDRLKRHMSKDHLKDSWTSKNKWLLHLKNHGLNPIMEILDEGTLDSIDKLEKYWISQFKSWGFKLKNETEGGDGYDWTGRKHKKESVRLMKMNHPLRKTICQYEIGTNKLVREWESSHDVEREFPNIKRGHVTRCCKGIENYNTVGGYYWRFKDNYFQYESPNNSPIKFGQYDKNWNLIKIYKST